MRKLFLLSFLLVSGMVFAQEPKAGSGNYIIRVYGNGNGANAGTYNKQGKMPPKWLKNKVSAAQYDTLVILNMLADVDYTGFKGCGKGQSCIAAEMATVQKAINAFMESPSEGGKRHYGNSGYIKKGIKPCKQQVVKNGYQADYVVYSSVDGYDAHFILSALFIKDKKKGSYTASTPRVAAYSLGGYSLDAVAKLSAADQTDPVTTMTIDANGESADYTLNGELKFEDPLGNKHKEHVNLTFRLLLPRL